MRRKFICGLLGAAILILAVGELFSRFYLGLGDPPISIPDAEIDYLFAPNQDCNRFGRRIVYNDASMRCDFNVFVGCRERNYYRIFLVGDSVVNGGTLTDHKELASTILQDRLDDSRTNIQVCNVSAGSWGPGNYAAYFRRHGGLVGTNDVLILEVNSHDLWEDDPTKTAGANVGRDVAFPDKKPFCALWDGFHRYALPRLRTSLGLAQVTTKVDMAKWGESLSDRSVAYNLNALKEVLSLPFRAKYMLIHRSRNESSEREVSLGEGRFRAFASELSIPIIESPLCDRDYRDAIHMNASGQKKMADAIWDALHGFEKN